MTDKDKTLAYDKAISFRWSDHDGRLHVDKSNLTRVQVAPYRGAEIPNWQALNLDPYKVYFGFRPPEELSDPETVKSVIGIPIQLNHHYDHPSSPAKATRVGSTGDSAKFDGTFLSNSLHIQDTDACSRIRDGSMRQLSLAYYYIPDFGCPGEYKGQKYDFTMRKIRGQHLALVEEGRAGESCVVEDSAFKGEIPKMDEENKNPETGKDGNPAVENTEVKIAEAMKMLADLLGGLHETNEMGEVVDKPAIDEDKDAKIKEIAAKFAELGAGEEEVKKLVDSLQSLAYQAKETQTTADEDATQEGAKDEDQEGTGEEGKTSNEGEDSNENESELDEVAIDALKACGYDNESPEFQRAFAEGVKYGERMEKKEPEKLDEEHESEGEERYLAQDAKLKALENKLKARDAYDECKQVLGNVKCAFDSAEDVYIAALKTLGVAIKKIKPEEAKAVYEGYIAGQSSAISRNVAQDSAMKENKDSLIGNILTNIKKD